ncbi:MAG: AbrB/MazE/SpoVT family DNA-binding domain-containing protein [Chloroflexota bacterium]|nr:MAG: AbrB/MazE/SpoVT family DNA-binding domain-containing protein [Chloroflexota bacterium]
MDTTTKDVREVMFVRLSSKGQLIIPKAIRSALGLRPGAHLHIEVVRDRIILEPVATVSPIEALYGQYVDCDLIAALEEEHRQELQNG